MDFGGKVRSVVIPGPVVVIPESEVVIPVSVDKPGSVVIPGPDVIPESVDTVSEVVGSTAKILWGMARLNTNVRINSKLNRYLPAFRCLLINIMCLSP